jgi:hypothetical protein
MGAAGSMRWGEYLIVDLGKLIEPRSISEHACGGCGLVCRSSGRAKHSDLAPQLADDRTKIESSLGPLNCVANDPTRTSD